MIKKWLVGYDYEAIVIVNSKSDAEEMILTFIEDEVYNADFIYGIPKSWSYGDALIYYSRGYWIQEVPII